MKPQEYRNTCVITEQTPYQIADGSSKGIQPGHGVLNPGRVVWLEKDLDEKLSEPSVSAYAEGIGVIAIDPHLLARMR
jgi:hypothetical protein